MRKKFVCLNYIEKVEDIPIKFKVINKAPAKILDWYIYRFNPYIIENLNITDAEGYLVKIPVLMNEAIENSEKLNTVISNTVSRLRDYDVDIIMLPKNCNTEVFEQNVATGKNLIPFFIMQAINKALKIVKKDIKTAEILILGDSEATTSLIYSIYPEVNFLSVMAEDNLDKYELLAENIFYDTGLNLQITRLNKSLLSSADIVINTTRNEGKLDFNFKRGAVYFDFSQDKDKTIELIRKREDLLIVDGFKIKQTETVMTLPYFELALFVKSREYRNIFLRGYDTRMAMDIKKQLKAMDVKLASFSQLDKVLNSNVFTRFLDRAGI